MKDYSGAFKPDLKLTEFDHALLASYARDIMLANHIHDRSALAPVAIEFGATAQTDVACDEWMSSSPIYNHRNQRCLNMSGDDVATVLKGLQVDIGAPHNFLNFHYELVSPEEGYFWTSTCGPYSYVRQMSNADRAMETQICHHMEDPTFDATVMAVNPLMRCRPVYRPPYTDRDIPVGGPCKWRVAIEHDIGLVEDCPNLELVQRTRAAQFEFSAVEAEGGGELADYSGEFKRDFRLSDLSHATLAMQCKEFMLHVLLLNYACYTSIEQRFGGDKLVPMQRAQWRHLAPVTVSRLRDTFGIGGSGMSAILKILQLAPFLPHEYLDLRYEQLSDTHGRISLMDCAARHEEAPRGIASLLATHPAEPGFDALIHAVNPRARLQLRDATADDVIEWDVIIDASASEIPASDLAAVVGGADIRTLDNSEHRYNYEYYDAL